VQQEPFGDFNQIFFKGGVAEMLPRTQLYLESSCACA